jgi:hypothetical protein
MISCESHPRSLFLGLRHVLHILTQSDFFQLVSYSSFFSSFNEGEKIRMHLSTKKDDQKQKKNFKRILKEKF